MKNVDYDDYIIIRLSIVILGVSAESPDEGLGHASSQDSCQGQAVR